MTLIAVGYRAGCWPAARFARCARSPPPRGGSRARTSASGSACVGPADELKELADTFDGMLDRLDGAFASQRHFVANASHELRTPLAIMRTEVDVALADPRASHVGAAGDGRGGARDDRPLRAADREPADAGAQRGQAPAARSRSTSPSLAADCVTDLRARADGGRVSSCSAELEPAWTRGEPGLLERMIANLIDNGDPPQRARRVPDGAATRAATAGVSLTGLATAGRGSTRPRRATLTEPFRRLDDRRRLRPGPLDRPLGGRGARRAARAARAGLGRADRADRAACRPGTGDVKRLTKRHGRLRRADVSGATTARHAQQERQSASAARGVHARGLAWPHAALRRRSTTTCPPAPAAPAPRHQLRAFRRD